VYDAMFSAVSLAGSSSPTDPTVRVCVRPALSQYFHVKGHNLD
jgi:hypothetical protein